MGPKRWWILCELIQTRVYDKPSSCKSVVVRSKEGLITLFQTKIFFLPIVWAFKRLIGGFGIFLGYLMPRTRIIWNAVNYWSWPRPMRVYWLTPLRPGQGWFATRCYCLQFQVVFKMWNNWYGSPTMPFRGCSRVFRSFIRLPVSPTPVVSANGFLMQPVVVETVKTLIKVGMMIDKKGLVDILTMFYLCLFSWCFSTNEYLIC